MTENGVRFDSCPVAWLSEHEEECMLVDDVIWLREHGVLPVAGGLLDQPARFVRAVAIVSNAIAKADRR